jgi:hypothetical protein
LLDVVLYVCMARAFPVIFFSTFRLRLTSVLHACIFFLCSFLHFFATFSTIYRQTYSFRIMAER